MKINDIVSGISGFLATVRVRRGRSNVTVKTIVFADGISQARAMLSEISDDSNLISVSRINDDKLRETRLSR